MDGIHDREEAPQDDMTKLFKAVVRWFETSYANGVILHSQIRWVVVAIFIGLSILFMAFALQLKPDEDQVDIFRFHLMFMESISLCHRFSYFIIILIVINFHIYLIPLQV